MSHFYYASSLDSNDDLTLPFMRPTGVDALIPCDEFHLRIDGCDYREVAESDAAFSGVPGPIGRRGSSTLHDRHADSKKMLGPD